MHDPSRLSLYIWRRFPLVSIVGGLLLAISLGQTASWINDQFRLANPPLDDSLNAPAAEAGACKATLSLRLKSFSGRVEQVGDPAPESRNQFLIEERWQQNLVTEFPGFPDAPDPTLLSPLYAAQPQPKRGSEPSRRSRTVLEPSRASTRTLGELSFEPPQNP